ncbi:hypothetical protein [Paenibacillus aceti]|uniref:DUF1902 domain-containing protein n=1 Tax=Paenibacillus aceti TaxID=1820010 RepID=A0ABQ1W6U8_9BACL|nr:hypothetical protein [Paenibacillus aceti]GGG15737.1 hypothetical protein GCM10010913_42120 [Paenibacillus aceti]
MRTEEHRYTCVLDRAGWRITLDVYTPRPVTSEELLPLAVAEAIEDLKLVGIDAAPDEFTPVGWKEAPVHDF